MKSRVTYEPWLPHVMQEKEDDHNNLYGYEILMLQVITFIPILIHKQIKKKEKYCIA